VVASAALSLLLLLLSLLCAYADAVEALAPRRMVALRRDSVALNVCCLYARVHHLLLRRTRSNDQNSTILEVRDVTHLNALTQGERTIVLLAHDEIFEGTTELARELCGGRSTWMSNSPYVSLAPTVMRYWPSGPRTRSMISRFIIKHFDTGQCI
jgi:hypothetical protein